MRNHILTIDQGTSSTKVILYDFNGRKIADSTHKIHKVTGIGSQIEQRPEEILISILDSISEVLELSGVSPESIAAVSIDNQGETIIPFRKDNLLPLYNAISWQDGRAESRIVELKKDHEINDYLTKKTGLITSSYFSAGKMEWLVRNVDVIRREMDAGNLVMATSEVWLINRLTKSRIFRTDYTTASRTMLFDIEARQWDSRLLGYFNLQPESMPEPVSSLGEFGVTDPEICFGIEAPVVASVVDQQSAMLGHKCLDKGDAKLTLGTGGFLQVKSGSNAENRSNVIIKSVFPDIFNEKSYLYEGQIYAVGSAIRWAKNIGLIRESEEINSLNKTESQAVPFFIPALSGVSAPYWKSGSLGAFLCMGLKTTKADMMLSVLNGIAFRTVQIIRLIQKETDVRIENLSVDGGVSRNTYILEIISKLTGINIIKPADEDLTSLGCFFLASISLGNLKSYDEIKEFALNPVVIRREVDINLEKHFDQWQELFKKIIE